MADVELQYDCVLAKAVRSFTFSSYVQTIKNKLADTDNIFYSPVSIVMALAALHVGAKANTARQIEHALGLTEAEAITLRADISKFLSTIVVTETEEDGSQKEVSQLRIANALALQRDYEVEKTFTDTLKTAFHSELSRVDFVHEAESARRALNSWVADHTAQQIKELFAPGVLNDMTRLVIANAVQFDAGWASEFDETATRDADFSLLTGTKHQVKMMTRETTKYSYWNNAPIPDWPEAPSPYFDTLRVGIVSLPYKRAGAEVLEMLIVLPEEQDGLRRLETLMASDPAALDTLISTFNNYARRREVNIQLPSFKFAEDFKLADTLKQLGVNDMFQGHVADFSGISQPHGHDLFVGSAIHRAVIDVDEKGTRAAAATAFTIELMCMPIPDTPVDFVVDHPCLFIIQASSVRLPLFVGRLAVPKRD